MKEKKYIKISLSTFFLILAIIVIMIMGYFIYKFYYEKEKIKNDYTTHLESELDKTKNAENEISEDNNAVENTTKAQNTTTNESNTVASNPPDIVLFKGLDIAHREDLELSIPYTNENKKKYEITYYNYENGKYVGETTGKLEVARR